MNLKEIKPNKKVYHKSNPMFRSKINKEGLIPKGKSESWLSDTKIEGKVIFVSNTDEPSEWFDSTYDDDIWEIDTTELTNKWYLDPNFNNSNYLITFKEIPREYIKLIYKGSGESFE